MSKPQRSAICADATNWSRTMSMSARSIAFGIWFSGDQATCDAAISGQLPSFSGASASSQPSWVEPFAPGMAELRADLRIRLGMDEIDQPLPRRLVFRLVEAGAARRDAPFGRHAGHLDIDEPRAALGALGIMDEMPVGRRAVDRLVLRHRRDDDAVLQFHAAQLERRQHRRAVARREPAWFWNHSSALPSHFSSRRRRFSWLMRCERVSSE